ncbi:hypothetical protein [Methylomicrobium sp. Wu6]|uniref:hypothetical protein n=1 Tax=Methylomicrobium sp. Wu6 TaxID=3107928 RepID=UPI002DD632D0|nr:hypothetical protein [Methylomicrobium sp. Wu6]MEC4748102.1 hypothetical protein [Methylomicrobium sp. Wu6]
MADENKALMKALEWVVDIDPPAIVASVAAERNKHPGLTNKQLACKAFSQARWKATSAGVVTGLPANPWVALPAATTDVAVTLRTEVYAAARTAIIFDESFFDYEDAKWELLIPVFGLNVGSQFARELGIRGGMGVTRAAIRKYLSKETLKAFQKIMLKYFGIKVTQKGVITKTVPIIGGLIGGGWNYIEVGRIKSRTILYFENNA